MSDILQRRRAATSAATRTPLDTLLSRRGLLAGATGTSLALLLAACATGEGSSAGSGSTSLGRVEWGWTLPTTWDSAVAIGYDVHVLSLVYSGLTKLSTTGEVEPDLAEKWEYNDSGDAVTFTLRPDLVFTDGTTVDAAAVKSSLERGRDLPEATSAQSLAVIADITVDSDLEITLRFDEPNYQIPLLLAGLIGHILSPTQAESGENIALNPVGAGPFLLEEYVPDSNAVLRRNPDYWNAEEIGIETLEVLPKPDASVAVAGVTSGQYTIAHIPNSQIDAADAAGLRVDINKIFNVYTLQVNTRFEPFTDDRVTQALSHAVDRQALVESILFGYGTPTWQPFNDEYVAYDPDLEELYPHDVDKAKALLAEAGYPDGVDVTLYVYSDSEVQQLAEVVQTQVEEAGFRLTIEVSPAGGGILQAHDYTLNFSSFSGRESPAQALEVLYSAGGWMNISEQESPNLQAALETIRNTPIDDDAYQDALRAATKIAVTENAPHVFLVNWVRGYAISPTVEGFDAYQHTQRFEGVSVAG